MKQLATYFCLAYGISWLIWLPNYGSAFGLNNIPVLPYQHAIGAFGPMLASLITTWIFNGSGDVKRLLQKGAQIKPFVYTLIALGSPFILAFLANIISYFSNQSPINLSGLLVVKEFPEFSFIQFALYNFIFFGFGEEFGWRGFALPHLQVKTNALVAGVILTLFWALWHWPLFLYRPGYVAMGIGGIMGWFFSLLTGSLLLTWLYNSSRGSILICAIFHSTIDIAFTADFADKNIINYMGFLITMWGLITIVVFKPKNLSKNAKVTTL